MSHEQVAVPGIPVPHYPATLTAGLSWPGNNGHCQTWSVYHFGWHLQCPKCKDGCVTLAVHADHEALTAKGSTRSKRRHKMYHKNHISTPNRLFSQAASIGAAQTKS